MKRTIYDCWKCIHCDDNNPYGIDYCGIQGTRCTFCCENCEDYDESTDNDHTSRAVIHGFTLIGWYIAGGLAALLFLLAFG